MFNRYCSEQRGVTLMETLAALFILSFVGVAAIVGVGTIVKLNSMSSTRITAESLARAELEYVSSQAYQSAPWTYTLPGGPPLWDPLHTGQPWDNEGYTVKVSSETKGVDIQTITVEVKYINNPDPDTPVLTIQTYRAQY